jgi:hypothetical protein
MIQEAFKVVKKLRKKFADFQMRVILMLMLLPLVIWCGCGSDEEGRMDENVERSQIERKLPTLKQNKVIRKYKKSAEESPYRFLHSEPDEVEKLEAELKKTGQADPVLDD